MTEEDFETKIDESLKHWSIMLDESLWAYQFVFKPPISSSYCQLVHDKACRLYVTLKNKAWWAMKLLNKDASLIALERKYQLLEFEEYTFQANENERLYKEKGNDTKRSGNVNAMRYHTFRHPSLSHKRWGYSISECFQTSSQIIRTAN